MRKSRTLIALGLTLVAALAAFSNRIPAEAAPPETRSLLGMLAEWQYPESKMLGGATMSDGGNPLIQSVKCRAILTTPDPVEKVIKFYEEKFATPAITDPLGNRLPIKDSDAKSVSTQDDSQDRPVTVRVIVVNKADTATTLVISRAAGEKETHIAWVHYLRLNAKTGKPD